MMSMVTPSYRTQLVHTSPMRLVVVNKLLRLQLKGGGISFSSQFQKVQTMVAQCHVLGLNIMMVSLYRTRSGSRDKDTTWDLLPPARPHLLKFHNVSKQCTSRRPT